jgi:hypothetical protein
MDEEMIREERAKAKANSSKYCGMSSPSFSGSGNMGSNSSSRYQGFSSDSYFASRESRNNSDDTGTRPAGAAAIARAAKSSPSKKEQDKSKDTNPTTSTSNNTTIDRAGVDLLLDFDSEPTITTNTFASSNNNNNDDDDGWGNFQSGTGADDGK